MAGAQAEAPVAAKSEAESTVEAPSIGTSVIDDLAKAPPTATVETQTVVPPAAVAEAQAVAPAAEAQTVAPPAAVAETQAAPPPPAEAQTIAPPAVANAADIPAQVPAAVTPIEKPAAVVSEVKAQASPAQELPELGSAGVNDAEKEKEWATRAKKLAEQNLNQISSERARADTKDYLTNQASSVLQQETEELLSPLGTAKLSLAVTPEGDFTGSSGQLFSPLYDVDGLLTYSQVGYLQKANGSQGNFGLGQRWMVGIGCWATTPCSTLISRISATVAASVPKPGVTIYAYRPTITTRCRHILHKQIMPSFSAVRLVATTLPPKVICRFTTSLGPHSALNSIAAPVSIC